MNFHNKKTIVAIAVFALAIVLFIYKSKHTTTSKLEIDNITHKRVVPLGVQKQNEQTTSKAAIAQGGNDVGQHAESLSVNPEMQAKIDPKLKEGFYVDRIGQNESGLRLLIVAVEQYRKVMGEYPKGDNISVSAQLAGKNSKRTPFIEWKASQVGEMGDFLDVWKTSVSFEIGADGKIKITSAGADKRIGTSDDEVIQNFESP